MNHCLNYSWKGDLESRKTKHMFVHFDNGNVKLNGIDRIFNVDFFARYGSDMPFFCISCFSGESSC